MDDKVKVSDPSQKYKIAIALIGGSAGLFLLFKIWQTLVEIKRFLIINGII